jgi:hypothetical protein
VLYSGIDTANNRSDALQKSCHQHLLTYRYFGLIVSLASRRTRLRNALPDTFKRASQWRTQDLLVHYRRRARAHFTQLAFAYACNQCGRGVCAAEIFNANMVKVIIDTDPGIGVCPLQALQILHFSMPLRVMYRATRRRRLSTGCAPVNACLPLLADDAMAILSAFNWSEVEVIGFTTLFGNVPVPMATQNALILRDMVAQHHPEGVRLSCTAERVRAIANSCIQCNRHAQLQQARLQDPRALAIPRILSHVPRTAACLLSHQQNAAT